MPHNAHVTLDEFLIAKGFAPNPMTPELRKEIDEANEQVFEGNKVMYSGCGGSIGIVKPVMDAFSSAHLICTGLLGPGNNAHCPNEKMSIAYCKKLT